MNVIKIYLTVVLGHLKKDPEVVVTSKPYNSGTPIMFSRDGDTFYGKVVSVFPTDEESELYKWLASAAGQAVRVDPVVKGVRT